MEQKEIHIMFSSSVQSPIFVFLKRIAAHARPSVRSLKFASYNPPANPGRAPQSQPVGKSLACFIYRPLFEGCHQTLHYMNQSCSNGRLQAPTKKSTTLDTPVNKLSFRIWYESTFGKRMPLYIRTEEKMDLLRQYNGRLKISV